MNEYDITEAFRKIENELIASMIRNMDRHRAEEDKEGREWSMWQAEQLKALEKYKVENQKKYQKQFKKINQAVAELISEARERGSMEQEIEILEAIQNGFKGMRKISRGMTGEFFKLNDRKLEALIKATTHDMERAEVAILRMANDQYRKAIFNAQVYANSGAGTYEKAVDMATKDMLAAGLNCVEYANGARHTLSNYAMMALRTASKRAYLQGEGEKRKEWGISTVIVNKRGNPCPKCLPFVGKVLIDDVWSGGKPEDGPYPLMSTAVKHGLYHPNCKDGHTTYFKGISTADDIWTKEELEEIGHSYQNEQKRQYIARQAEKYERLEKYSLDSENRKRYRDRKNTWKAELAKYKNNGIMKTESWSEDAIRRRQLDEASIAGHKTEYSFLYDSDGNRLFKKHGGKHEIIYSDHELSLMKDGVLTHNHPMGATFSPDDLCLMLVSGLKEQRAIGHEGIFVLRQPKKWAEEISTPEKIFEEYDKIRAELESEFIQAYIDGKITTEQEYSIRYQAKILEVFTHKYQLSYFVEKR